MTKHAKSSNHLQAVDLPKTMAVEIPLPLLEAFGSIESSFFELCIDSGQQVLQAMMEQDREDLCGPRWKRDPDRRAIKRIASFLTKGDGFFDQTNKRSRLGQCSLGEGFLDYTIP